MDYDQKKVYEAENLVFQNEEKLSEIGLKKFFYHIIGDPWFISKYGQDYHLYIIGQGFYNYSFAWHKEIYILENEHFTESAICHEQAHAVKNIRGNLHGKAFRNRYVELVKRYICQSKGEELEEEFKKYFEKD